MRSNIRIKRQLALCIGLLLATLAVADDVGYKTVAQALTSLKQMKDVSFSTVRGWTIVCAPDRSVLSRGREAHGDFDRQRIKSDDECFV
jgi:hypothetical protein